MIEKYKFNETWNGTKLLNEVADKHQKKIAMDTVKNPKKSLLGGPSEKEAIATLKDKFGYSDAQIKKLQSKSLTEKVDVDAIIKTVIDTTWSKDNESQMKVLQLLKGIATSDDPKANAFMKKLDNFTSGMKAGGEKKEGAELSEGKTAEAVEYQIADLPAGAKAKDYMIQIESQGRRTNWINVVPGVITGIQHFFSEYYGLHETKQ